MAISQEHSSCGVSKPLVLFCGWLHMVLTVLAALYIEVHLLVIVFFLRKESTAEDAITNSDSGVSGFDIAAIVAASVVIFMLVTLDIMLLIGLHKNQAPKITLWIAVTMIVLVLSTYTGIVHAHELGQDFLYFAAGQTIRVLIWTAINFYHKGINENGSTLIQGEMPPAYDQQENIPATKGNLNNI